MLERETGAGELTGLLQSWAAGDTVARERLFDVVYPELRGLSARRLLHERANISLQPTEVVHETFLKLVRQDRVTWQCRAQFFALASTMIRRVLIDHAKRRLRAKRGDGAVHVTLDDVAVAGRPMEVDVIDLDRALTELAQVRATVVRIVELRFFGGLNVEETAEATGMSRATVARRWRFGRAWLTQRLRTST